MIEWGAAKSQFEYEVRVGYLCVVVQGGSPAEAILRARRQWSRDMPRMWDVIHGLADDRFEVIARNAG